MLRRVMMAGNFGRYLDDLPVTPVAAWGIKRLIRGAGVALRVVRSTDNAEQDIGFSGDLLDTPALTAFLGSATGRVAVIYDQAGSADLEQSASSKQPLIYSAGSYLGHIKCDGVDDLMVSSALSLGTAFLGAYMALTRPNTSDNRAFFDTAGNGAYENGASVYCGTGGRWYLQARDGASTVGQTGFNPGSLTTPATVTCLYDRGGSTLDDQARLWRNGAAQTRTNLFGVGLSGNFGSNPVAIGALLDGTLCSNTAYMSLAVYKADTAANRSAIEALI